LSRAEGSPRILAAAVALGATRGVGALTMQAIAKAAGVSKALVLYHFADRATLLAALHAQLSTAAASRLHDAAASADPLGAWRSLALREAEAGELALFCALGREAEVCDSLVDRDAAASTAESAREAEATALGVAIFRALGLTPRFSPALVGRVLVRHLDGMAFRRWYATARESAGDARTRVADAEADAEAMEAELDAFALALLALGE
jgi:AcrR family transcriptional regulator